MRTSHAQDTSATADGVASCASNTKQDLVIDGVLYHLPWDAAAVGAARNPMLQSIPLEHEEHDDKEHENDEHDDQQEVEAEDVADGQPAEDDEVKIMKCTRTMII